MTTRWTATRIYLAQRVLPRVAFWTISLGFPLLVLALALLG